MHEHPVRLDVVGDERTGGLRVEHEVQHTRPVSSERTKVGAEVDHQEALDQRWPHHLDPEQLADAAARAVAPDDVAAPHPARLAGVEIQDVGHDGIVELLGVHPLMAVAQLGARRCTKLVGQDRLEAVLREVAQRGRRVLETRVALTFERQSADQVAVEPSDEVDVARVGGVLAGRADAVHVEPGLTTDLVGAGVDDMSRW